LIGDVAPKATAIEQPQMNSIESISRVTSTLHPKKLSGASSVATAPEFGNALQDALKSVSRLQQESSSIARRLQMDQPGITLEETMIAMQKSSMSFQAVVQVRNRLVSAYNEVSNMQV
jgi:flagellar hook-basal body complex protein FliE